MCVSLSGWVGRVEDQPPGLVPAAAAVGVALGPLLSPDARVLVVAEGDASHPDARPDACEIVMVYAGNADDVLCDSAWSLPADTPIVRALAADHIAFVVQVGDLNDCRPVQRRVRAAAASGDLGDVRSWRVGVDQPGGTVRWGRLDGGPPVDAPDGVLAAPPACPGTLDGPQPEVIGAAVDREATRTALYSNGSARFTATSAGTLRLQLCGSPAGGQMPQPTVAIEPGPAATSGIRTLRPPVTGQPAWTDLGPVEAGDHVLVTYTDDLVSPDGADRNLFVTGLQIVPVDGSLPR